MDIQKMFAERIGGKDFGTKNDIYKFALIKKWKQEAQDKPELFMHIGNCICKWLCMIKQLQS